MSEALRRKLAYAICPEVQAQLDELGKAGLRVLGENLGLRTGLGVLMRWAVAHGLEKDEMEGLAKSANDQAQMMLAIFSLTNGGSDAVDLMRDEAPEP